MTTSAITLKLFPMTKNIALLRNFGTNLRKYRNHRGFSQRALFARCGIDNGMLSRMENGQVNVTINTIHILAEALDIPCWKLLISANEDSI
jgi:transcriptional regulator with XRE-family HTH domain